MLASVITADQLQQQLGSDQIRIFDCRFYLTDKSKGQREFLLAHIPGSLYADLDNDLSNPHVQGITGRHPMPDREKFQSFLRSAGLTLDDHVVIYDQSHGGIAARLWWLLIQSGHPKVSILEGGWEGWQKLGYPTESTELSFAESSYTFNINPSLISDHENLKKAIENDEVVVVDARARQRYMGKEEPIDPIAGHIPTAISLPFLENLDSKGQFKSAAELQNRFSEAFSDSADSIFYCGSGVTACHNIFAASLAGYPMAKLYVGSWSRWIVDPEVEKIQET